MYHRWRSSSSSASTSRGERRSSGLELLLAPLLGMSLVTFGACDNGGKDGDESQESSTGKDKDEETGEDDEDSSEEDDSGTKEDGESEDGKSKKKKDKKKGKKKKKKDDDEEEEDSKGSDGGEDDGEDDEESSSTGGDDEETSTDEPGEDDSTEEDEKDDSTKDDSKGNGTGYPKNNRNCDKVQWGPKKGRIGIGAPLPRQEVPGFFDSDGDNKVERGKVVDVGTCAMHLTGRKCGIIVVGRKG